MISKLDKTVNFHQQALGLRAARQELLASNIANADTPNFKAKDIDFSNVLKEKLATTAPATALSTTSPMHISNNKGSGISNSVLYRVPLQPSADGNTVDMDSERTRFADNSIKYDASLTFISGQFRNLLSAIQER
ncbi:flagellar basal-body rod protein FlgB [Nitrosomonas marina]|uniref:Flagellar basal body rod protein FlgB n=1 Tax=Nitrosomonas marina TaxID=917 RepID=A0A1H9YMI4_9PROT|nr:flagellar basal body rod protein FlgB [Nitrosomonas marina]SES69704.1 flagellar basal-body rod protein FlgB [Nitrosomonas marina]